MAFVANAGGLRRRHACFQEIDDGPGGVTYPTPVLSPPDHQPPGEIADGIATSEQRLAQLHGLGEIIIHRTVFFLRVWRNDAARIPVGYLVVPPPFSSETQDVPDG